MAEDCFDDRAVARLDDKTLEALRGRAERANAVRRWPDEYGHEPDAEYYPATELRWRELADSGVPSIRVAPATVAGLCVFAGRAGMPPTDSETRAAYVDMVPDEQMIAWSPQRNAPCWCGSAKKYKKCCGAVH